MSGKYRVEKRMEIAGAHSLKLPYDSKCKTLHGHNWKIRVVCESEILNAAGMVIDFASISSVVNRMDHDNLNEWIEQPTAENIARMIAGGIGSSCVLVEVQESEGNIACFIP